MRNDKDLETMRRAGEMDFADIYCAIHVNPDNESEKRVAYWALDVMQEDDLCSDTFERYCDYEQKRFAYESGE
jgi:hypothetical protein